MVPYLFTILLCINIIHLKNSQGLFRGRVKKKNRSPLYSLDSSQRLCMISLEWAPPPPSPTAHGLWHDWPGIEPATFWCMGWGSTKWTTLARQCCHSFLSKFIFIVESKFKRPKSNASSSRKIFQILQPDSPHRMLFAPTSWGLQLYV